MPRPLRPYSDGLVFHAINRGNNRQNVFSSLADRTAFLDALRNTRDRYPFDLYGFCLMSNHFHLLLEPAKGVSISRIMQSLTVAHTWRWHRRHHGSGHVWQGRFKSPVIQDDSHLLLALRYIESNPRRAKMVRRLEDYPAAWSSYRYHAFGEPHDLLTPLPTWPAAKRAAGNVGKWWQGQCHRDIPPEELDRIRRSVNSGRPLGDERFVKKMAGLLGIDLHPRKRGRPRGS